MHTNIPVRSREQMVPLAPGLDHPAIAVDDEDHVPVDAAFALLRAHPDRSRVPSYPGGRGFGSRVEPRCRMKMRFGDFGPPDLYLIAGMRTFAEAGV